MSAAASDHLILEFLWSGLSVPQLPGSHKWVTISIKSKKLKSFHGQLRCYGCIRAFRTRSAPYPSGLASGKRVSRDAQMIKIPISMKIHNFHRTIATIAAVTLACAAISLGDEVVTTTESAGTISEFSPDTIIIRSESSPEPIRYSYSKTTTYVDDAGNPVSMEVIKSGLPVTVHYVKEGDRVIASRVIVHRTTTSAPASVEEKKTTTTTTTTGGRPSHEERKAEKEERKAEKHEDKAQRDLERAGDK
jgi:hypothetical protein